MIGEAKPLLMPGEGTGEQKKKSARGAEGRCVPLNSSQLQVLEQYRSGELRQEANKRTRISGHGRVRKDDGTFVDIGGSTGGFVRTVLDGRTEPVFRDLG